MYPRLRLARNLLKEDGLIFISIDDNEVNNLIKCCNEIFGEENFVSQLIWENKEGGGGSDSKLFRIKHEYVLVYARYIQFAEINGVPITNEERYTLKDEFENERGSYYLQKLGMGSLGYIASLDYPIKGPEGDIYPNNDDKKINRWRWGKDKVEWGLKNKFIEFRKDNSGEWQVYTKQYLNMDNEGNVIERTNRPLGVINEFSSTQANKSLQKLFSQKVFDYPKPVELIQFLIRLCTQKDDIIVDFFSGSGTTLHAIMKLNQEDQGLRKFISIQLPEKIDEKSEAFKSGYKTITEIGKERIRRAGKKIKEQNLFHSGNLDIGFKVFKLDSSNIKGWDGQPENLEKSLFESQDNIKSDRTEEDVLFEILLKYGLDLTLPIEEKVIEGKKVFNVGFGALFICLGNDLTSKVAEGIGQWKETLKPETCRVIFKDGGFTDVEKTNSVQTLKRFGIQEIKSI
jgi:adenine-specific DNA-methyltransferase